MTHYNIFYANLEPDDRRTRAIADIVDWLGYDTYDAISQCFRQMEQEEGRPSWKRFSMALSLSGIEGYPLVAWYETLFGKLDEVGGQ